MLCKGNIIIRMMMQPLDPPVEILSLSPSDWQAYRQLRLEALLDSPQAFGTSYLEQQMKPDSYWQTRLAEAARGKNGWLLFARAGQDLVGMMGAFRGAMGNLSVTDQATIIAVYVTPAWRGKGVSRLLMQGILALLQTKGFRQVWLGVNGQQEAAVRLYQSFGFTTVSTVHQQMADGLTHEEYIMQKVL